MKVISLINYKGGVGKTTLTANIGAQLAFMGKRVLLIDLDPQASLTFSFLSQDEWGEKYAQHRTIKNWYDAFIDREIEASIDNLIVIPQKAQSKISKGTLSLICSHLDLINIDLELATRLVGGTERDIRNNFLRVYPRLRVGLESIKDRFDIVLIDCPPNFNIVTKTAIVASDGIVVPTKADYLSTIGFEGLHRNVEKLRTDFNKYVDDSNSDVTKMNPQWLGIIFTMVNLRLGEPIKSQKGFVSSIIQSSIEKLSHDIVFDEVTRENKTLHADAPLDGVPVVLENVPNQTTYIAVKKELVDVTTALLKRIEKL